MIIKVEIVPKLVQLFPDLKLLIKEKKRGRKRWQRLKQAGDKSELNRLNNQISTITRSRIIYVLDRDIEDPIDKNNTVRKVAWSKI